MDNAIYSKEYDLRGIVIKNSYIITHVFKYDIFYIKPNLHVRCGQKQKQKYRTSWVVQLVQLFRDETHQKNLIKL